MKRYVRERDGMRCTVCGMTADQHKARYGSTLDVHRLNPGSLYHPSGCVTLCKTCHGPQPRRKKGAPDYALGCLIRITLDDDLAKALDAFMRSQVVAVKKQAVGIGALRKFLIERGHLKPGD